MSPADAMLWDAAPATVRSALRLVLREAVKGNGQRNGQHAGYVACARCGKRRRCWVTRGLPECAVCRGQTQSEEAGA